MAKEIVRKLISVFKETEDRLNVINSISLEKAEIPFNLSKFVRFTLKKDDVIDEFIEKEKDR